MYVNVHVCMCVCLFASRCYEKDADANILRLHSCSSVAKEKGRQLDVQIPRGGHIFMYVCVYICIYENIC